MLQLPQPLWCTIGYAFVLIDTRLNLPLSGFCTSKRFSICRLSGTSTRFHQPVQRTHGLIAQIAELIVFVVHLTDNCWSCQTCQPNRTKLPFFEHVIFLFLYVLHWFLVYRYLACRYKELSGTKQLTYELQLVNKIYWCFKKGPST